MIKLQIVFNNILMIMFAGCITTDILMLKVHLHDCILFAVSCTSIENFSVMLDNIANCSDAKFIVKQTHRV